MLEVLRHVWYGHVHEKGPRVVALTFRQHMI